VNVRRVAVVGASGRMGRAIVRLARDAGVDIVCAVAASDVGADVGELAGIGKTGVAISSTLDAVAGAGVVIDFSTPAVTALLAPIAARSGVAIVSGTTGLDAAARTALDAASARVPVLWEANMSVGVHVLADLVGAAVAALGPGYDIEIVETHHAKKVDAPSGTALLLVQSARDARDDSASLAHGRSGRPGPRPATEIGLHAVRGGDVIGDHSVHLLGCGERLELTHRATSRDVFAHGALRAAAWIAGRSAGIYTMRDVLAAIVRS
jgi:4-hydroxy-tetrahydrodipicolinate reductase